MVRESDRYRYCDIVHPRTLSLLLLTALASTACGGPGPNPGTPDSGVVGTTDSGVVGTTDSGVVGMTDSGAVGPADSGADPADSGLGGPADLGAPPAQGVVIGNVTRTAQPAAGGRGHLYVALFTADPVTDRSNATNVAYARIENVDLSAANSSVAYRVEGVPLRAQPYFITVFLDDNHTVNASDPSQAGPDRGDLVALERLHSPQVTVATAATVTRDLVLNFNLPF